ncbi:MAG: M16 family metallopeptidase [Christensenellales bacterium]|jgi:predicted Zn-dependent peptidase
MGKIKNYDNGLRLINKYMPATRSVSIGVFVGVGSANETPDNNGISHFTEHMLFKGTESRSAFEIAETIDGIGGQINAYTSKQMTSYYTVSVDEHLETCLDVLSDIFFNSVFDDEQLNKEQKVVLEEISMVEDTPDDLCLDLAVASYYNDHPLGYPILGTRQNVESFNRDKLNEFVSRYYNPMNTVVSIAGNLTDDKAYKLIDKYFARKMKPQGVVPEKLSKSVRKSTLYTRFKEIEQANVAIVFPGLEFGNELEVAILLMNSVLGGGMSSLLFQKIREQMGLAYSVYSFPSSYINNGSYTIYFGTNKEKILDALEGTKKVIEDLKTKGLTEKEFLRGKEQLKGGLVLGQESSSAIMNASGKMAIMKNDIFDIDKRLQAIKELTMEDINRVIKKVFDFKDVSMSYVGPKIDHDLMSIIQKG